MEVQTMNLVAWLLSQTGVRSNPGWDSGIICLIISHSCLQQTVDDGFSDATGLDFP